MHDRDLSQGHSSLLSLEGFHLITHRFFTCRLVRRNLLFSSFRHFLWPCFEDFAPLTSLPVTIRPSNGDSPLIAVCVSHFVAVLERKGAILALFSGGRFTGATPCYH